ncbi:MAG: hypothetical protein AAGB04_00075 [Pseudomonadota bacterium]
MQSTPGGSWTTRISTAPGGDFASCAVYQDMVYQASASQTTVRRNSLSGGSEEALTIDGLGTVPTNCGLVALHGDRLVLSGDAGSPQVVYMAAIGNPRNWDFSAEDRAGAYANSGGQEGRVGEIITSLISHNQNCLLIGCTDSLYVIRGNPRVPGNRIEVLNHEVGPLMQSAWCKTDSDDTIVMTRQGLYAMPPGCGDTMQNISDGRLPDDLVGIDPGAGDKVSLVHDGRFRGVHIYLDRASGSDAHYFFDLKPGGGFWPMSFSAGTMKLGVSFKRAASNTESDVIAMTGSSAYQFDTSAGESIDSHLYYGPIALGSPHLEGVLTEISGVLSEDSDAVSWEVYVGKSPQEAFNSTVAFTGTDWINQGLNLRQHPRVRGVAAYLKVFATGSARWSIEEIVGTAYPAAKRRV